MLRFAANLSVPFREYDFYDRFRAAADLGFAAVEFSLLDNHDRAKIVQAVRDASVKVAMFGFAYGNMPAGDRGFASHPEKVERWRAEFAEALELARRVGAQCVNSLAGCVVPGLSRETQIDCLVGNFTWALPQVEKAGLTLLLEAVNPYDNPGYLLTRSAEVLDVLKRIDSPRCKFQYDVYHMQRVQGELVRTMRENIGAIGWVHIADNPGRHQPGTGEINYRFVLGALEETGYQGYVGLEYSPTGSTEEGYGWLPRACRVSCTVDDLNL